MAGKTTKTRLEEELLQVKIERERHELEVAVERDKSDRAYAGRHRIYNFFGAVDDTSVRSCMYDLGLWTRRDPGEDITIVFNSPGGNVFEGLALFDYIKELQSRGTTFTTVAAGMAASMGGILLQAGDHRLMHPNAFMLIHEVSSMSWGTSSEMKDEVKLMDRLQDRTLNILAERSTLTKRQIKNKWERKDWWLDAQEALKLGFVDEVRGQ